MVKKVYIKIFGLVKTLKLVETSATTNNDKE